MVESGVTIAAMESTSTYWKPPFYCLEEVEDIWLVNLPRCPGASPHPPSWQLGSRR